MLSMSQIERVSGKGSKTVYILFFQSVELCEEQKREFRSTMEELRGKLQETILNRDSILDLR